MKHLALLADCSTALLAQQLSRDFMIYEPPGSGMWVQPCLKPQALVDFDPDYVLILLTHEQDQSTLDATLGALVQVLPKDVLILSTQATNISNRIVHFPLSSDPAYYDARMPILAGMPFSLKGLISISDLLYDYILAFTSKRHKVLALDLDNTLWHGVIGEETVEPNVALIQQLHFFKEQGIILTILSKNNESDVARAWGFLDKSLFSAITINWDAKYENLQDQAHQLNLGLDAFVFVDDNPAEREEMKAALPEVIVPEYPLDWDKLYRTYFMKFAQTPEDALRTASYQAVVKRDELRSRLSLKEYLASLHIETTVRHAELADVPRIVELSRKTHQFNINPREWDEDAVEDELSVFWVILTCDRFADEGLVAFARIKDCVLTDFAMSCRVMGRGIEHALMDYVPISKAIFTSNKRNEAAEAFLSKEGFLS